MKGKNVRHNLYKEPYVRIPRIHILFRYRRYSRKQKNRLKSLMTFTGYSVLMRSLPV